jgi:uncharacterized protein (TIGR01777 family)
MRVVITGATGFIGTALCRELHTDYEVVAVSRDPEKARQSIGDVATVLPCDTDAPDDWRRAVDGALAVVNLAGENIAAGRWTTARKNRILRSRLGLTQALVNSIERAQQKPKVFIQASAVGYYGDRGDEILDENSSSGTGFLADVCNKWEQAAGRLENLGVRLAIIRLGPVLGAEGGMMQKLLPAFRFFLGGHPGSGEQWLSWIHIDDVTHALRFLIETDPLRGVFNLTAPNPVLAKDFYRLVGKAMHRPAIFPLPGFMLKILVGQMATELLLSGQKAIPRKLLESCYKFRYADADSAIESIVK